MKTNASEKSLAARLNAAADWIDVHAPAEHRCTVSASMSALEINLWFDSESALRDTLRFLGGKWEKRPDTTLMIFRQRHEDFHVDLNINRKEVCERIVVERVEVPETVVPSHIEEKVEWRCRPLLPEETVSR